MIPANTGAPRANAWVISAIARGAATNAEITPTNAEAPATAAETASANAETAARTMGGPSMATRQAGTTADHANGPRHADRPHPPCFPVVGAKPATMQACDTAARTGACCTGSICVVQTSAACAAAAGRYVGDPTVRNAAGNLITPCRPADLNNSGALEVADIFAFLNAWFAGCP